MWDFIDTQAKADLIICGRYNYLILFVILLQNSERNEGLEEFFQVTNTGTWRETFQISSLYDLHQNPHWSITSYSLIHEISSALSKLNR